MFREELGLLADHLVFGLNKADSIYPHNWHHEANVPSSEQLKHLEDAERYFVEEMRRVLPRRSPFRVATYSALQYYNLARLFSLLMEAMPKKRRWVLERRMDLANFIDKVDPRLLAEVTGVGRAGPAGRQAPAREWILARMSEADLRSCLQQGWTPEEWWRRKGDT